MKDFREADMRFVPVQKVREAEVLTRVNGNITDTFLTKYFCLNVEYFVIGSILIITRSRYSGKVIVIDSPKDLQVFMLRELNRYEEDHLYDLMVKVNERKIKTVYRQLILNPDAIDRGKDFLNMLAKSGKIIEQKPGDKML